MSYKPKGGPAFIWSMDFSSDSNYLAVGCWDGNAYLYRLHHADRVDVQSIEAADNAAADDDDDARSNGAPRVRVEEVMVVPRKDRVYAVALDAEAKHLCIGGPSTRARATPDHS